MLAFKFYTGKGGASHVTEGTVMFDRRTDVVAVHFKECPPHSVFDWHGAPEAQYVITPAGTLEFTTRDGETSSFTRATCWSRPIQLAPVTNGA
jgi:hypothetical protein